MSYKLIGTALALAIVSSSATADPAGKIGSVDPAVFATNPLSLSDELVAQPVLVPSSTPADYANILQGDLGAPVSLTAQLALPEMAAAPYAAIIIVPGSGGVGPHHIVQMKMLVENGFAVLVIDPFTARGISETISDQGRLPFSASAYDVLAATQFLRTREDIDPKRIGVLGSSRGGTGALMAASKPVSEAVLGEGAGIASVVAGYPWCGAQFKSGALADESQLLILQGDRDNWVSVQQCQAAAQAARLTGSNVAIHLFHKAYHAFDREDVSPRDIEAYTALSFPIIYLDDDGTFINWRTDEADPTIKGDFYSKYLVQGGFAQKGVTIGSAGDQAKEYRKEVLDFFTAPLSSPTPHENE